MSVNHSADARGDLSMAHDMSREDLAMWGELLVAHDSGGESHGELYIAHDACDITQCEPIGSTEHCCPERDNTKHGEPPPHEANDLLVTADADDGPHEALPPHGSTRQSSKHVEASAPWLRRQVSDVDPQECRESTAGDACDALGACGELRTHMPSNAMQRTPLVVTETCHPTRDDRNAADRSPGSGGKKQAWEQSQSHCCNFEASFTGSSRGELCLNNGNFLWTATHEIGRASCRERVYPAV